MMRSFGRVGKQRLREARTIAVDFLILLLAGICLGTLAKVSDETFGSLGYTYTVIAVCKLNLSNYRPCNCFLNCLLKAEDTSFGMTHESFRCNQEPIAFYVKFSSKHKMP